MWEQWLKMHRKSNVGGLFRKGRAVIQPVSRKALATGPRWPWRPCWRDARKPSILKASELAEAGDATALRLCLDRLYPVRRDRYIAFALPKLETAADAVKAAGAIADAVAAAELTPSEAAELVKVVDGFANALKVEEFQKRLEVVEALLKTEATA